MTQAVLPGLRAQGWGRIVRIRGGDALSALCLGMDERAAELPRTAVYVPYALWKPERRALQRDEAVIAQWKRNAWPRLKNTARRGAHLVFLDESDALPRRAADRARQ